MAKAKEKPAYLHALKRGSLQRVLFLSCSKRVDKGVIRKSACFASAILHAAATFI